MSYRGMNPSQMDAYGLSTPVARPATVVRTGERGKKDSLPAPRSIGPRMRTLRLGPRQRAASGLALFVAGGMWMMAILGFSMPWYAAVAMATMITGAFIMVGSLNQGSGRARRELRNDRCDH